LLRTVLRCFTCYDLCWLLLLLQDGRIDYEEFCAMMRAGNEDVMKAHSTLKTGILGVKPPRVTE
jgi:hypothetical protein